MAEIKASEPHLRIAHTINEAIMMRDFSKRQRKVLDLILRLSWGCGKQEARIPRQRDFELVGVGEGHIKNELRWLVESKVIEISGDLYSFQQDFSKWQVSRIKPFSPEKLTELVSLNLNHPYRNGKLSGSELTKTVSQSLPKQEVSTYQISKSATPALGSPKERGGGEGRGLPPIKESSRSKDLRIDDTVNRIWEAVLLKVRAEVSSTNYRTWWEGTVGVGWLGDCFAIGVRDDFVAEYLSKNQVSLIERILTKVLGRYVPTSFVNIGREEGTGE